MPQLRSLSAALVAAVLSCSAPPVAGSALRVSIELEQGLRSKCVLLEVRDAAGAVLKKSRGAQTEGRMVLSAAVFRDDLPETVTLQALGFADADCTMATAPAEASDPKEETFPPTNLKDVTLLVRRTVTMSVDVDNDGSPAELDCDDRDARRKPGLPEDCTDGKDNDCNQLSDCGDGVCTGKQCRLTASVCAPSGLCTETICSNGLDDDGDGALDCADSDCASRPCANGGTCANGTCGNAMNETGLCFDDVDNDGDGMKDCLDADCNLQACSDGLACNVGETCTNSQCGGGMAVSCAQSSNVCLAVTGTCREPDGGCAFSPLSTDAGCDDGLSCTELDACDGDGGCAGSPRQCTTPPAGPCWEPSGQCDEALDGGCVYAIAVGRLSCADTDPCTVNDACLEDGGCLGVLLDCSNALPPDECQTPTGMCLGGACTFMPRAGACDGGVCMAGQCLPVDGGVTPDAGDADAGLPDAGPLDAGSPSDAGVLIDAGAPVDAGPGFLLPSNVPLATIESATAATHLNFTCDATLTLNPVGYVDNLLCAEPTLPAPVLVSQTNGPTLVVFVMDRLTIAPGVRVRVLRGSSGSPADRAVVFAVKADAAINGVLDASAVEGWFGLNNLLESGPGGQGAFCPASTNGTQLGSRSGGGQGGSFGLAGGAGGRGADNGGAGAPATTPNTDATLVPLRGGCAGSRGGRGASDRYGRAGGAIQLWVRGTLALNGAVVANGGRGLSAQAEGGGGGGGGSGGGILIEATTLNIGSSAIIAANGAGGAEGSSIGWGDNGDNGTVGVSTAAGGTGNNICGGFGGRGGARAGGATSGQEGGVEGTCTNLGGGGGGGGSVGRVRINALNPCTIGMGARISPQATSNRSGCSP
ncbi:MAG: putative metal-binding motif-containing protein [Myxococcaceae bacterium]|nr:putative metal-binding motif-containing protein [Myxococcaceae bacterium]